MSSLKKRFDIAWNAVNGKIEADRGYIKEFCIGGIEKIIKKSSDPNLAVRCCFEMWKEDGKLWIKCDSYCFPEDKFRENCLACYNSIVENFPKLKEAFRNYNKTN